jgi:hypothetical protein
MMSMLETRRAWQDAHASEPSARARAVQPMWQARRERSRAILRLLQAIFSPATRHWNQDRLGARDPRAALWR